MCEPYVFLNLNLLRSQGQVLHSGIAMLEMIQRVINGLENTIQKKRLKEMNTIKENMAAIFKYQKKNCCKGELLISRVCHTKQCVQVAREQFYTGFQQNFLDTGRVRKAGESFFTANC